MPKNDEGEFELVLGNRQLLSVFFIVVVLLGVFFTMGYIVGRNTSSEAAAQMAAIPGQPLVVESETPATAKTSSPPAATPKPPPAKPVAAADPTPSPPARTTTPPPAAKPKPAPPAPTPPPAPSPSGVQAPGTGQTFLQVAATSRPEGEVLRDVLSKRGFRCQLAPVPGQDLIRVLVGPVNGAEELAAARSKLQAAGFKPFTRRY